MDGPRNVTQAYGGTFTVQRPWADLALHVAGLGGITAALVMRTRRAGNAEEPGPTPHGRTGPAWPARVILSAAALGLVGGLLDAARGTAALEVPLPGQDLGPSLAFVFLGFPMAAVALLMLASRRPAARSIASAALWGLAAWLLTTSRFVAFVSPAPGL